MPCEYAELVCASNFTFLSGASHPQELVARAAELGYSAIAISDECSLAGVVRALEEARRCAQRGQPIRLIPGSLFRLEDGSRLVLLPEDHQGYTQICTLITRGRRNAPKGEYRLANERFEHGLDHCLAVWLPANDEQASRFPAPAFGARRLHSTSQSGNPSGSLRSPARISPQTPASSETASENFLTAHWLAVRFPGRCWLGVSLAYGPDDRGRLARLADIASAAGLPLVACGDVQMHVRTRRMLHDVLAAVRHKCTVAELGYRALPSGERHLRRREQLEGLFGAAMMHTAADIAERCRFRLEQLHYRYPREVVPDGMNPAEHLRQLTEAGIARRWGRNPISPSLREQIDKELALISEMNYEPYFLTVYDIVEFARGRGILCQGRGSAANSAVCYCLGITEVDPARMNMLFERFISRERDEPPDIDVDFEHERREEVIQYVYRKYGRERAALAATVISYRPKSAIRDVGKALGFSLAQVDQMARNTAWWDDPEGFSRRIQQQGFEADSLKIRQLIHLVHSIVGFPRHLSQHVGGFVISEAPLASLVPVENAAMPDRTVIQWDKEDLETLGMLKVDCLGLGMLTAIHRCLDLIKVIKGSEPFFDNEKRALTPLSDIPPEDPETYAMIQKADTVGVFQIESRAQMAMLPRLKPECFYDLVVEVAIVRPGPIQGDMVHPYLQRRRGEERVEYPSEALRRVLERTLGVPIFQEQVMQIAMVAAGFSGSEADQLRRSMAAWARRGGMEHMHQRLVSGMLERGYNAQFAEQVFQQIRGFGEYGFPESHAASFALLVYVSCWMKRHYPAAFTCALLNSQPMGFYQPAQLVQDAQQHGVKVLPVDVRYSEWDCTLEKGVRSIFAAGSKNEPDPFSLRLGLRMVKGFAEEAGRRLVAARRERAFNDAQDLATRAALDRGHLARLADAAALRGLAGHRHRARWEVAAVEKPAPKGSEPFFFSWKKGSDPYSIRPPTEADDIRTDYASTGLTLGRHPIALMRSSLRRRRAVTARELHTRPHGSRLRACGLVTMRQRPSTASGTIFITLEDETGTVNVIVWPRLWEKQRAELIGASVLAVDGVLETDGEVHHLIADRVHDFSALAGGLASRSRDFR